ncbi:MAG: hypothetical protein ACPHGW_09855 [Pseudohongiellaceae bacterium]
MDCIPVSDVASYTIPSERARGSYPWMGMVKAVFIAIAEDDKFRTDHIQKRIATGTITPTMGGD